MAQESARRSEATRTNLEKVVAERVTRARVAAGMSLADLAEHLDIGMTQLQRLESGRNRISAGNLHKIARGLGVPVAWFFQPTPRDDVATNQMRVQHLRFQRDVQGIEDEVSLNLLLQLTRRILTNQGKLKARVQREPGLDAA